jgi:coenzyme F420-reducing hydrogenase beta subunit
MSPNRCTSCDKQTATPAVISTGQLAAPVKYYVVYANIPAGKIDDFVEATPTPHTECDLQHAAQPLEDR